MTAKRTSRLGVDAARTWSLPQWSQELPADKPGHQLQSCEVARYELFTTYRNTSSKTLLTKGFQEVLCREKAKNMREDLT